MSIGDFLHPSDGSPPFSSEAPACTEDAREELTLAPLLPRIRAVLDDLNKTDAPLPGLRASTTLLDRLGNNVLLLQESFTERLYESLRQWGIDASSKLTLRLDAEARLCLEGDHPERERVRDMLAAFPEYSEMFAEIAVQSAALRDLRNLWAMTMYDRVQDNYAALAAASLNSYYQISLKGEMNHFYFAR